MFEFKVGGRRVSANQFGKEIEREVLRRADQAIERRAREWRCPRCRRSGRVVRKGQGEYSIEHTCSS